LKSPCAGTECRDKQDLEDKGLGRRDTVEGEQGGGSYEWIRRRWGWTDCPGQGVLKKLKAFFEAPSADRRGGHKR